MSLVPANFCSRNSRDCEVSCHMINSHSCLMVRHIGHVHTIQYNTIQISLSTPHGGFSETNINSTGNQKIKNKKNTQELSINNY